MSGNSACVEINFFPQRVFSVLYSKRTQHGWLKKLWTFKMPSLYFLIDFSQYMFLVPLQHCEKNEELKFVAYSSYKY